MSLFSPSAPATSADDDATLSAEEVAIEEASTDRLLFLSDGVFAIVITLLVLEIKVPHPAHATGEAAATLAGVFHSIAGLWPSLLGYVLSFATVGIMWQNHCAIFRYIRRADHTLTVLNGVLLLFIAFIPFVTALLADYLVLERSYQQAATLVYSGFLVLTAVSFNALWRYARDPRHDLLAATIDKRLVAHVSARYRFGPLLYVAAFALAWVSVPAALGLLCALALWFALPYGQEAPAWEVRLARYVKR